MNRNDDFDDTFNAWLRGEAPPEAPDRVLSSALRRVADLPQRRGWLARVHNGTQMAFVVRAAAIVAAIALAAFIGLRFVNLAPAVGGPSSPSPTGAATSIPSTTASPSTTLPNPTPVATQTARADCVNPPPDIAALSDQIDPVACYGNAPLTLDAYPVAVQVDCPSSVQPAWLGCPSGELLLVEETRKNGPFLLVVLDPAIGVSWSKHLYTNVRITGHYDDPAAQTCRETGQSPAIGGTPEPAAGIIERCRRAFVVTKVAPLRLSSPVEPSIEPTPFAPPSPQCPSPPTQVPLPDVTVSVGGAPGVIAERGSSTTITCTTTGTHDAVASDPTEVLSAAIGDPLELALPAGWGFLRVEGTAMIPIDSPDRPALIEVPVSAPVGESIVRLNLWLVRDDGRVVGQMEISVRVRLR